ncbi:lipocalin family protein [Pseudochrobactrum asaccharolyticum]|uniref:lipocalin family protein n=1 Tax=Pseudochrobactrum asaccharolyticum TaxID=354351 RepID=UPI000DE855DC|nr:lipocalin family protein [Ochrobactrum sp. MR28]MBX8818794.1 lipocalin family protein [Ochrobactrum sp. MR31]
MDNRFEKGLFKTTAEYTLNSDDTVYVLNAGVDEISGRYMCVSGTAVFVRKKTLAL